MYLEKFYITLYSVEYKTVMPLWINKKARVKGFVNIFRKILKMDYRVSNQKQLCPLWINKKARVKGFVNVFRKNLNILYIVRGYLMTWAPDDLET